MDAYSLLRTLGSLGMVLGLLAGALWVVRRYDIKLPGRVGTTHRKRVELVERLSLDAKRSVALIRRDGAEHLILISPDGHAVIESGIAAQSAPAASTVQPLPAKKATRGKRGPYAPRDTTRWNRALVKELLREQA
jgi:flagellar biogenesis protein FliO